jgi:hypothetical protein
MTSRPRITTKARKARKARESAKVQAARAEQWAASLPSLTHDELIAFTNTLARLVVQSVREIRAEMEEGRPRDFYFGVASPRKRATSKARSRNS